MVTSGSIPSASSSAASASLLGASEPATPAVNEEDLREQLRILTQNLKRREPLKPTYKHLLTDGIVTARKPALPKDKFYRRIGSRLRETVETFMAETQGKDPFDRISQREPLEEEKLRAALTLREFKEHEQVPLLEATLAALPKRRGMDEMTRRRHLDAVALGLQTSSSRKRQLLSQQQQRNDKPKLATSLLSNVSKPTPALKPTTAIDQQQSLDDDDENTARPRRDDLKRKREDEGRSRPRTEDNKQSVGGKSSSTTNARKIPPPAFETPQQVLHKFYQPIFKMLWDMEFPYLGNTNPFRMVIDRDNCAAVGAPDYFDVVGKPMNLTFIQRKVEAMEYSQLSDFFQDVDLMLQNAIKYNSDPHNPYRIAAEEMLKRYKRAAKTTVKNIRQKHKAAAPTPTQET